MSESFWKIRWDLDDSKATDYVEKDKLINIPSDLIAEMNYPGFKEVRGKVIDASPNSIVYIPMDNPRDRVPFGIIGIGRDALYEYTYWGVDESEEVAVENVRGVFVCDGIKYIAKGAFWGNYNLEAISLPESLLLLGDSCLADTNIIEIRIPNSVQYIGQGCFSGCKKMQECILPKNLQVIENKAFFRCYSLSSISLPRGITAIGDEAFSESGIRAITFPEGVRSIGKRAFSDCESLFLVTLPKSLINIADDAFDPPEKNALLTFYVYPGSYGLMWAREHGYPVKSAEI